MGRSRKSRREKGVRRRPRVMVSACSWARNQNPSAVECSQTTSLRPVGFTGSASLGSKFTHTSLARTEQQHRRTRRLVAVASPNDDLQEVCCAECLMKPCMHTLSRSLARSPPPPRSTLCFESVRYSSRRRLVVDCFCSRLKQRPTVAGRELVSDSGAGVLVPSSQGFDHRDSRDRRQGSKLFKRFLGRYSTSTGRVRRVRRIQHTQTHTQKHTHSLTHAHNKIIQKNGRQVSSRRSKESNKEVSRENLPTWPVTDVACSWTSEEER